MGRILLVEDDALPRYVLATCLRQDGHEIWECRDIESARRSLAVEKYDVVFTDQQMPQGAEVLAAARDSDPAVSVILLTAQSNADARKKAGASRCDFLPKPLQPEVVRTMASSACERTRLLRENTLLRERLEQLEGEPEVHGNSPAMQALRPRIAHVAPGEAPVLITGELGTGKEALARSIHHAGPRSQRPFIPLNCAAFAEPELESALFGQESDSTGVGRPSLFEAAQGGTLFLDHVHATPPRLQHRLERVLTFGQVLRAGSLNPRAVDARILAASHLDLQRLAREGQFRETLFLRLSVMRIHLPPLRERLDDVPLLSEIVSRRVAAEFGVSRKKLSSEALGVLQNYAYPGNVRELRNLIERAYLLSAGEEILERDLPIAFAPQGQLLAKEEAQREAPSVPIVPADRFSLTAVLEQTEKALITHVLSATGGAQAEAARRMGLSRSVLAYKLNKYGIRIPTR
jgi:DNA-binding NtrC family response regulator